MGVFGDGDFFMGSVDYEDCVWEFVEVDDVGKVFLYVDYFVFDGGGFFGGEF